MCHNKQLVLKRVLADIDGYFGDGFIGSRFPLMVVAGQVDNDSVDKLFPRTFEKRKWKFMLWQFS